MLLRLLRDFFNTYGFDCTYWIAYSGGMDSHVLLTLCHQLRLEYPLKLRAIHINHGLNKNAVAWQEHCAAICNALAIDLVSFPIHIDCSMGLSIEEAARDKRYAMLSTCLHTNDILLTAHHEDDQAETVLLQLLRGSGLKGLAAMPTIRPLGKGLHGRPLLNASRNEMLRYAEQNKLTFIDDDSNQNKQLTRNFIRHDILSIIKKRFPSVSTTLSRTASHCAEAQSLLEEFVMTQYGEMHGTKANTLSVTKLLKMQPKLQRLILRTWIQAQGFPLPDVRKLDTILSTVLIAARDRFPCVHWKNTELRKFRDDLYLLTPKQNPSHHVYPWHFTDKLSLPGIGLLHATFTKGQGLRMDINNISVQFRRGGEIVNVAKRGRRTLKKLLQEWDIPPWERDRIPLLFDDNKLIAVVGYFLDEDYTVKPNQTGCTLRLETE